MVLFKKSPIEPFEPPKYLPKDWEIWVIEATGEAFTTYDGYLRKMDYYRQKLFSCEITGHRHMTYFEALKSEKLGMREIDSVFPDALRGPLLRKVQFSTISRTDELVNHLYETFKEDFYPGEQVTIEEPETGQRLSGKIGEKQQILSTSQNPKQAPTARYYVFVAGKPTREVVVTNKEVFRERRSFTKQVLRSFLKHTIYRDRFEGAPWQVKEEIAKRYKIDTKVPPHLTADAILAQRKAAAALKRSKGASQMSNTNPSLTEVKDLAMKIREHKGKLPQDLVVRFHEALEAIKDPVAAASVNAAKREQQLAAAAAKKAAQSLPRPREKTPPPLPKYPIEDLEVLSKPKKGYRPKFKRLQVDMPSVNYPEASQSLEDIEESSIGPLLEIWNTLNVHNTYFFLDSFTLDDFLGAILFSSEDVNCELFGEIHCAILKTLVNSEGEQEASIPTLSSSSESSSAENSGASTPAPPEPKEDTAPTTRRKSKRISEALLEAAQTEDNKKDELDNEPPKNRARELLQENDWIDRIKDRDFGRGGWQCVMMGLIEHMLLSDDEPNATYHKILSHLAPAHQVPTRETVRRNYSQLDINLRISALETALLLTVTSKSFKEAMETRIEQQTMDRKEKVDLQRRKKPYVMELQDLDMQRKLQRPDPTHDNSEISDQAVETSGPGDEEAKINDDTDVETEDDLPQRFRSLRRTAGRTNELKRKREEEERLEKEKKAKLEEAALTPEEKQYRKTLKDIENKKDEIKEIEDAITQMEIRLRENACHRTRSLGKDRFFNRYWWFERNGMPFGGHETSSTAHYGYANGRIWIQGPDDLEHNGVFEQTDHEAKQYRLQMGMTIAERRKAEENGTSLGSAGEWGYYSTPEELDRLMAWLDDRGNRERDLLKELSAWRDKIAECMDAMNAHVQEAEEKKAELEEPVVGIATRKKTHADNNITKYPCLAWSNSVALQELGQLHSDGPVARRMRRGGGRPANKDKAASKRETRRGGRG